MNKVKNYFTFSRGERNGVFVLVLILVGLITTMELSRNFSANAQTDFSEYNQDVNDFLAQQRVEEEQQEQKKNASNYSSKKRTKKKTYTKRKAERFAFDPNNLPRADWKRLGFSDKQIDGIFKFEEKGGKFFKKEDVKKLYVVDDELYNELEPFIEIEQDQFNKKGNTTSPKYNYTVDINLAEQEELKKLWGIGPKLAERIIKYRDLIGGFRDKDQLLEVYGIKQEVLDKNNDNIELSTNGLLKINVNECSVEELKSHPYFDWNLANSIVSVRDKHGKYQTLNDIKKSKLVTEEVFLKIEPYLTVE